MKLPILLIRQISVSIAPSIRSQCHFLCELACVETAAGGGLTFVLVTVCVCLLHCLLAPVCKYQKGVCCRVDSGDRWLISQEEEKANLLL